MTQNALATINPGTMDGAALAVWLEQFKANQRSSDRGATRPAYAAAGMIWPQVISSTQEIVHYDDGSQGVPLAKVNPTDHTLFEIALASKDAGAGYGPSLILDRDSASPAAADLLGAILFKMRNASAAAILAALDTLEIVAATAGTESARRVFQTVRAGVLAERMGLGAGLHMAGAGGDKGAGTINATAFFKGGADITSAQTLTDAATIAWDAAAGPIAKVTLGGNRTMGAPTNLTADCFYVLRVNTGAGAFSLAWNAIYKFGGAGTPTITTTAGKTDIFTFLYDGANLQEVGRNQAI